MIESKKLFSILEEKFPKSIAKKNNDFVGLMLGKSPVIIKKILLCLDFDDEVLPFVLKEKPDVIITHHPFFFGKKKKILKYDIKKKQLAEKLDELNIPIYSFHTNFDTAPDGMNDYLSKTLKLNNVYAPKSNQMMRIGSLSKEMNVLDFAKYVKETLLVDYGLLINKGSSIIKKVGIIAGGGSRSWKIAKKENCDIYISGDAPHHVRRDISLNSFNYLDLPHEIEKAFMPAMKNILHYLDSTLDIVVVDHEELPKII